MMNPPSDPDPQDDGVSHHNDITMTRSGRIPHNDTRANNNNTQPGEGGGRGALTSNNRSRVCSKGSLQYTLGRWRVSSWGLDFARLDWTEKGTRRGHASQAPKKGLGRGPRPVAHHMRTCTSRRKPERPTSQKNGDSAPSPKPMTHGVRSGVELGVDPMGKYAHAPLCATTHFPCRQAGRQVKGESSGSFASLLIAADVQSSLHFHSWWWRWWGC
jgi:hypothetical protein